MGNFVSTKKEEKITRTKRIYGPILTKETLEELKRLPLTREEL